MSVFSILYAVLLLLVIASNILILVSQYQLRKELVVTNVFIASLTCSNLIVGIVILLVVIKMKVNESSGPTNDVVDCYVTPYLQMFYLSANIFSMVALAVDLYRAAVIKAIIDRQRRRAWVLRSLAVSWLLAAVYSTTVFMQVSSGEIY